MTTNRMPRLAAAFLTVILGLAAGCSKTESKSTNSISTTPTTPTANGDKPGGGKVPPGATAQDGNKVGGAGAAGGAGGRTVGGPPGGFKQGE